MSHDVSHGVWGIKKDAEDSIQTRLMERTRANFCSVYQAEQLFLRNDVRTNEKELTSTVLNLCTFV